MAQSLRFALRQIAKNPGFAALAILTLALGIGANTAMFTVIDSVLLRPLPYRDADRIVAIRPVDHEATSWPNFVDIREQARHFSDVAGYLPDFVVARTSKSSEGVFAIHATANIFDVLGVNPMLGRGFLPGDNQPGAPNVVILSAPFWREHFAADPHAVGQQLKVGDEPYTILGVLPDGFNFRESDVSKGIWIAYQPPPNAMKERGSTFLDVLGKLKPAVSMEAAQAELTAISRGIQQNYPKEAKDLRLQLIPLRNLVTSQIKPVFLALTGALILVLLIACANVSNLLLARCLARSQELAVRTALGASRRALFAQMLIEGGVLCAFGAAAGLALAHFMLIGVHRLPPDLIPRSQEIHIRATIFLALLVGAAIVTLLSSIVPAWIATRTAPQTVLQEGSRGTSGGPKRSRLSAAMVGGEVALSVVLLISSGLMFRTLYKLQHMYLGFDESNVTQFLAMPGNAAGFFTGTTKSSAQADQANSIALRVYEPLLEKIQNLPGVESAAYTNSVPFQGIDMNSSIHILGRPEEQTQKDHAFVRAISAGFTQVMRVPVIRGRSITADDSANSPYVALINETLARRYFGNQDPLGQQLDLGGKDTGAIKPYTIVGVTADVVQTKLGQAILPEIDLPYPQIPITGFFYGFLVAPETNYVVRTRGRVEIAPAVRNLFHQAAPEFALEEVKTLESAHGEADFNQRLGLYLVAAFAGIAVVMVLAGLYGVLSQIVGQRRREIGIRMALGADRALILRMMLQRGLMLIGIGLGLGLLASLAAQQFLKSFLYGVSPMDAGTYITVSALLTAVGMLAAFIPARRAASIEPTQALRAE